MNSVFYLGGHLKFGSRPHHKYPTNIETTRRPSTAYPRLYCAKRGRSTRFPCRLMSLIIRAYIVASGFLPEDTSQSFARAFGECRGYARDYGLNTFQSFLNSFDERKAGQLGLGCLISLGGIFRHVAFCYRIPGRKGIRTNLYERKLSAVLLDISVQAVSGRCHWCLAG